MHRAKEMHTKWNKSTVLPQLHGIGNIVRTSFQSCWCHSFFVSPEATTYHAGLLIQPACSTHGKRMSAIVGQSFMSKCWCKCDARIISVVGFSTLSWPSFKVFFLLFLARFPSTLWQIPVAGSGHALASCVDPLSHAIHQGHAKGEGYVTVATSWHENWMPFDSRSPVFIVRGLQVQSKFCFFTEVCRRMKSSWQTQDCIQDSVAFFAAQHGQVCPTWWFCQFTSLWIGRQN